MTNTPASLTTTYSARKDSPEKRYLTETELADRLHLSVQFLRKRRDKGEPPYAAKFGNRVRYPIAEVERYEADAFKRFTRPTSRLPEEGGAH